MVPGIKELIAPVTDDERKKFEAIHFENTDVHGAVGGDQTLFDDKVQTVSTKYWQHQEIMLTISLWDECVSNQ